MFIYQEVENGITISVPSDSNMGNILVAYVTYNRVVCYPVDNVKLAEVKKCAEKVLNIISDGPNTVGTCEVCGDPVAVKYSKKQKKHTTCICPKCTAKKDNETYAQYLEAPLLQGSMFIIFNDRLVISANDTCFVDVNFKRLCKQEDCLDLYNAIVAAAKEKGIKVEYKLHMRDKLLETYAAYHEVYNKMKFTFAEIKQAALRVKENGIHANPKNDMYLVKAHKLANGFTDKYEDNEAVVNINGTLCYLEELLQDVKDISPAFATMTTLYL